MPIKLSDLEARNIVLHAQLLDGSKGITHNKKGVYDIIDHLGYVQLDTISVILIESVPRMAGFPDSYLLDNFAVCVFDEGEN